MRTTRLTARGTRTRHLSTHILSPSDRGESTPFLSANPHPESGGEDLCPGIESPANLVLKLRTKQWVFDCMPQTCNFSLVGHVGHRLERQSARSIQRATTSSQRKICVLPWRITSAKMPAGRGTFEPLDQILDLLPVACASKQTGDPSARSACSWFPSKRPEQVVCLVPRLLGMCNLLGCVVMTSPGCIRMTVSRSRQGGPNIDAVKACLGPSIQRHGG